MQLVAQVPFAINNCYKSTFFYRTNPGMELRSVVSKLHTIRTIMERIIGW